MRINAQMQANAAASSTKMGTNQAGNTASSWGSDPNIAIRPGSTEVQRDRGDGEQEQSERDPAPSVALRRGQVDRVGHRRVPFGSPASTTTARSHATAPPMFGPPLAESITP